MAQNQAFAPEPGWFENWLATLDAYGVEFLMLDVHHDRDLFQLVRSRPGWTVDLRDGATVLFARTGAPGDARAAA